jgi:hypothetical protein
MAPSGRTRAFSVVHEHANSAMLLKFGKSRGTYAQPADKAEQIRASLRYTTVLSQIIEEVGRWSHWTAPPPILYSLCLQ